MNLNEWFMIKHKLTRISISGEHPQQNDLRLICNTVLQKTFWKPQDLNCFSWHLDWGMWYQLFFFQKSSTDLFYFRTIRITELRSGLFVHLTWRHYWFCSSCATQYPVWKSPPGSRNNSLGMLGAEMPKGSWRSHCVHMEYSATLG